MQGRDKETGDGTGNAASGKMLRGDAYGRGMEALS